MIEMFWIHSDKQSISSLFLSLPTPLGWSPNYHSGGSTGWETSHGLL